MDHSVSIIPINIAGESMLPLLKRGSSATAALGSVKEISLGDIAVFKAGEGFICHRIFNKTKSGGKLFLRTKGDALFNFDNPVGEDAVLGKIIAFRRWGFDIKVDNTLSRLTGLLLGCVAPFFVKIIRYAVYRKN